MIKAPTTPNQAKKRIADILEGGDRELLHLIWGHREELIAWAGGAPKLGPMDPNQSYMGVMTTREVFAGILECGDCDEEDEELLDIVWSLREDLIAWARDSKAEGAR